MNLETNNKVRIGSDTFALAVSPDKTKYAFVNFINDVYELDIYSSKGEKLEKIQMKENWGRIDRWLDNENLMLVLNEPDDINEPKYPEPVIVINPFTNQVRRLEPNFPDIEKVLNFIPWYPASTVVYNSDLTRAVYPSVYENQGYIALYSIPDNRKIVEVAINNFGLQDHPPIWSPDGSKFIFWGDDEFILVTHDGKYSKLTYINQADKKGEATDYPYSAEFYSWSPDNRHVAFWLNSLKEKIHSLALLDTETGEVTDLCISAGSDPKRPISYFISSPVWSPDGTSIIVSANFQQGDDLVVKNDMLLVDIHNFNIYKISTNNFPIGWLIAP